MDTVSLSPGVVTALNQAILVTYAPHFIQPYSAASCPEPFTSDSIGIPQGKTHHDGIHIFPVIITNGAPFSIMVHFYTAVIAKVAAICKTDLACKYHESYYTFAQRSKEDMLHYKAR